MAVMNTICRLMIFGIALPLLLTGCVSMTAQSVDINVMKGRDVDTVISELERQGLTCGRKYEGKVVNSKEVSGTVGCGATEMAIICPESYGIAISFDLVTNKVNSATKLRRKNCF